MELIENKYLLTKGIRVLVTLAHKENEAIMLYALESIIPLLQKKGTYKKVVRTCKKARKLGINNYEINTIDDAVYNVIIRKSVNQGIMIFKTRAVDFYS